MSKKYLGVDVSYCQPNADFAKMKAAGVDFIMIKASQGRTEDYNAPFTDPCFVKNVKKLISLKGDIYGGSYHYLCARNVAEAEAEADFFIRLITPYRFNLQLWAAVDVEELKFLPLKKAELTAVVKAFCDKVAKAGFRPMVYSSTWWLDNNFDVPSGVPIWEANWSRTEIPERAKMLQVGLTNIDGVGDVDTNIAYDIIGDVNGDGKVNAKDVKAMMEFIAGGGGSIDESQGDLNRDGYVNAKDVKKLLETLAK